MVKTMSKKINVKNMNFAALSDYNKASMELVRLNNEKAALLKPLREERAEILNKRAKALEEDGAVLDEVLRLYSTDKVDTDMAAINYQYAEPLRECAKEQNKVLKLVNGNIFYAYALSMQSQDSLFKATGDYAYTKRNGESVTVKIGNNEHFFACIKSLYVELGAFGTDDEKAMDKVVQYHAKRVGGLNFKRGTQENELKNKATICNSLLRDVIEYLKLRDVIEVAEDGTITRKLSPVGVTRTEEVA